MIENTNNGTEMSFLRASFVTVAGVVGAGVGFVFGAHAASEISSSASDIMLLLPMVSSAVGGGVSGLSAGAVTSSRLWRRVLN